MCNRNSTNRQIVVRRMAEMKQTSHAGKKEPRMSSEGAREQPASSNGASAHARLTHRLFLLAFMAEVSAHWGEWNRRCGKLNLRARRAPACAPAHRRSEPARGDAARQLHPPRCEHRNCTTP